MKWMNYRKIYFGLSGLVIAIGIFSLLRWGLNLGIDFKRLRY
jgi:preprotein translocase subunit SecF